MLSLRETEALRLRVAGLTTAEAAIEMEVSASVVNAYIKRAMVKTGTSHISDAAIVALGMTPDEVIYTRRRCENWFTMGTRVLSEFHASPWLSPSQARVLKELEDKLLGRKPKKRKTS